MSTVADICVSLPCPVATPSTPGDPPASLPSTLTPTANELSVTSLTTARSEATCTTMPTSPVADHDRHVLADARARALADLDRVVEVGDRAGHDRGPHGSQVPDEREVGLLEQLLVRLLGHLPGGDLALHGVDLGLQRLVALLEVVVLEGAVPQVADRAEHGLGAVPDRREHREHAGCGPESMGPKPRKSRVSSVSEVRTSSTRVNRAAARPPGEGHGALADQLVLDENSTPLSASNSSSD